MNKIWQWIKLKWKWLSMIFIGSGVAMVATFGAGTADFNVEWKLVKSYPSEKVFEVTITNPNGSKINQNVDVLIDKSDVLLDKVEIEITRWVDEIYYKEKPVFIKQEVTEVFSDLSLVEATSTDLILTENKVKRGKKEKKVLSNVISYNIIPATDSVPTSTEVTYLKDIQTGIEQIEKKRSAVREFNRVGQDKTDKEIKTKYGNLSLPKQGEETKWLIRISNLPHREKDFGNLGYISIIIGDNLFN
jgi:ribosomal protein S8E